MTAATSTARVDGHGDDSPRDQLRLAVLVGSVRAGRLGPLVAGWFLDRARQRPEWCTDLIDLAGLDLPAGLDGSGTPRPWPHASAPRTPSSSPPRTTTPTPESSRPPSTPSVSSGAPEPVGFVSDGGTAGGLRAVEQLHLVFAELHAVTVRETVSFAAAHRQFGDDSVLIDPDRAEPSAAALHDRLTWWARTLARAAPTTPPPPERDWPARPALELPARCRGRRRPAARRLRPGQVE